MPYKNTEDLPENVRNPLPDAAQRIWLRVFNKSLKDNDEDYARRVAWKAVKNAGYRKGEGGKWTKKMSDERYFVPFSDRGDGWFLYFPLGKTYHGGRAIDFSLEDAEEMVENFHVNDVPGYDLPLNILHQDSHGVYGYIDDLRFNGSEVQWRPRFRDEKKEEIKSLGYKYFSPEIWFKNYQARDGQKYNNVAMGGGLTPRPRLGRNATVAVFSDDDGWEYTMPQTWFEKLMDKLDKLLSFADEAYECECLDCGHTFESEEHCADSKCPECGSDNVRREDRPSKEEKSDSKEIDMEMAEQVSQSVVERIEVWYKEKFGNKEGKDTADFSEELDAFKQELVGEFTEQLSAKDEEIEKLNDAREALETKAQELEEKFAEEERQRRLAEFTDKAERLNVPVEADKFGEVLMQFHDADESEDKANYELLVSVLEAKGNAQEMGELFSEKGSDADTGDDLEKFSALVKERMDKFDESWGEASEHVMEERPELYKEYNEEAVKASSYDNGVGDNVEVV